MSSSKTTSKTNSVQAPDFSGDSAGLVDALNTRAQGSGLNPQAQNYLEGLVNGGFPTQNNANIDDIVNHNRALAQYDTQAQLGQLAGNTYRSAEGARARAAGNLVATNEAALDNSEQGLRYGDLESQLNDQTNAASELFNSQAQSANQQEALLAQQRGQVGSGSGSVTNTPNPVGTGLQLVGALANGFYGGGSLGGSGGYATNLFNGGGNAAGMFGGGAAAPASSLGTGFGYGAGQQFGNALLNSWSKL